MKTQKKHSMFWVIVTPVTSLGLWKEITTEVRGKSLTVTTVTNEDIWQETIVNLRRIDEWGQQWQLRRIRYAKRCACSATRSKGIFSQPMIDGQTVSPCNINICEMNFDINAPTTGQPAPTTGQSAPTTASVNMTGYSGKLTLLYSPCYPTPLLNPRTYYKPALASQGSCPRALDYIANCR